MPSVVITHNSGAGSELGHLGSWLSARDFEITKVNRDLGIDATIADEADLLIMLGSRWSVARPMTRPEDDAHAALAISTEIELVERRISRDRPTLGICFGGQLLCRALGGDVNHLGSMFMEWETPKSDLPQITQEWFFGHEDHFTLPPHAEPIAEADHATVVFRHGRAWGLQFHPEVNGEILGMWFDEFGYEDSTVQHLIDHAQLNDAVNEANAFALLDEIWADMSRLG